MSLLRRPVLHRDRSTDPGPFLIASLILGILVGAGAALLVMTIEQVTDFVGSAADAMGGRWVVIVAVPMAMFLTWAIDRWLGPGVAGGGVSDVMASLSLDAGYLPSRLIPGKIVATGLSLGSGGSGGREGPVVLIGAAIGSAFARRSRFGQDEVRALVAAGAGAGLGAVFSAPIAGMLFALEVVLGSLEIRHLNAVVIVSVAASVTSQAIVGEESFLRSPAYHLDDARQLLLFALLAVIIGVMGFLFLKLLHLTERTTHPHLTKWVKPTVAGLLVGVVGLLRPESLGTGQEFLRSLLRSSDGDGRLWWILGIIALTKIVTTSLTHGAGGSVGSFMPSMVIGGTVGAGFAVAIGGLWTTTPIQPGAYALVGMAAMLTFVARAPLTAILLVFELTGSYGMVLPLMLASIIAAAMGERLHPGSAYTAALRHRGIHLPQHEDRDLLDTVKVQDVMTWVQTVNQSDSIDELRTVMAGGNHHGVPVVDDAARLVGIATLTDLPAPDAAPDTTVRSIMTRRVITASPSMPVSAALARMASLRLGRLAVVDAAGKLVGMFRRESVVRAYHHALTRSTSDELYRARVNLRRNKRADFFEVTVRAGSPVADQPVKAVRWPPEATLVSIRRNQAVIIPHGDTTIWIGDELTIYCQFGTRTAVREMIRPPTDDPDQTPG